MLKLTMALRHKPFIIKIVISLVTTWLFASSTVTAFAEDAVQINVVALFSNKAVIIVNNGKPQVLTVGDKSREGIKLIHADTSKATLDIGGKRKELAMGQAATVGGSAASAVGSAILYANSAGHHMSEGMINNANVTFLVDTGASTIAMNSSDARRAGMQYKNRERVEVQTANGSVYAYHVVIDRLKLGSMTLNQVEGMVLEGDSPSVVLLGMSALNRVDMKRDGIALTLTKKY